MTSYPKCDIFNKYSECIATVTAAPLTSRSITLARAVGQFYRRDRGHLRRRPTLCFLMIPRTLLAMLMLWQNSYKLLGLTRNHQGHQTGCCRRNCIKKCHSDGASHACFSFLVSPSVSPQVLGLLPRPVWGWTLTVLLLLGWELDTTPCLAQLLIIVHACMGVGSCLILSLGASDQGYNEPSENNIRILANRTKH